MSTETLDDVYRADPDGCARAFFAALGREIVAEDDIRHVDDGPITIQALAYARHLAHWRSLAAMLARAPEDVRAEYARLCPPETEAADIDLGGGWTASTARAESSYGQPVYVAERCTHGEDVAHSLEEALGCGMLAAVRAARGLSQQAAAAQIGCSVGAIRRWEAGTRRPVGKYRADLEAWLIGR